MSEGAYAFCRQRLADLDRDRYLSVLYAPEEVRADLFALYAFNAEISEIILHARDVMPGEIRFQWWREVLTNGAYSASGSPIAEALTETLRRHALPSVAFEAYLDARVGDLYADGFETRTELEAYCGETASALVQLAMVILDADAARAGADAAGHGGCAQGIAGIVRLFDFFRTRGRCPVPDDMLGAAGLTAAAWLNGSDLAGSERAKSMMISLAQDHQQKFERAAIKLSRSLRPAVLPLALTPRYLAKAERGNQQISELTRQWTMLRRASSGW